MAAGGSSEPPPGAPRALVVDDAPELQSVVIAVLEQEGYAVEATASGRDGVERARRGAPELIVLDLSLPDLDGVEVCRAIRAFSDAYVVMLTARDEEVDKLIGLSVGADDYMTKPFSARELAARVRALRRRPRAGVAGPADSPAARRFGELEVNAQAREVRVAGAVVELTKIEFDLLDALSERPGAVLTRDLLLERVWGPTWFGDDHVVAVHVSKLREKLGDRRREPPWIRTVRGVGYRFDAGR
jgi:DNA-binding response OmpR family regulator